MSDLKDRLHLKQNLELVCIIDSVDSYTSEAKEFAAAVLQERFLETHDLIALAKEYWENELQKSLKTYLKLGAPPESNFLTEDELRLIFAKKYQEFLARKELLAVDSTVYWFVI